MSRTYTHVPYKVAAAREGTIDHNHVNGECITFPPRQNFISYAHGVNGKCKKVLKVERVKCDHSDRKKVVRTITDVWTKEVREEVLKECPEGRDIVVHRYPWGGYSPSWHWETKIDRDDSRECVCDEMPDDWDYSNSWLVQSVTREAS